MEKVDFCPHLLSPTLHLHSSFLVSHSVLSFLLRSELRPNLFSHLPPLLCSRVYTSLLCLSCLPDLTGLRLFYWPCSNFSKASPSYSQLLSGGPQKSIWHLSLGCPQQRETGRSRGHPTTGTSSWADGWGGPCNHRTQLCAIYTPSPPPTCLAA